MEGPVYALPPLPHALLGWHEVSIELGTSTYATAYLSYWHRPHAPIDPRHCPGIFLRLSKQSSPSEALTLCKRVLTRRSSALRRAREKSASTCTSRFMYLTIDEILSSVFQISHGPICFFRCDPVAPRLLSGQGKEQFSAQLATGTRPDGRGQGALR